MHLAFRYLINHSNNKLNGYLQLSDLEKIGLSSKQVNKLYLQWLLCFFAWKWTTEQEPYTFLTPFEQLPCRFKVYLGQQSRASFLKKMPACNWFQFWLFHLHLLCMLLIVINSCNRGCSLKFKFLCVVPLELALENDFCFGRKLYFFTRLYWSLEENLCVITLFDSVSILWLLIQNCLCLSKWSELLMLF